MNSAINTPEGKAWLLDILKELPVSVTFKKVNGEERTMKCTLNESLIPKTTVETDTPKREKKINENVIPVYDLEKESWRSFRLDSIISVDFTIQ